MTPSQEAPFCAICGRHHDPSVLCSLCIEDQALQDLGFDRPTKRNRAEFKKANREANWTMIKILLLIVVFFVLMFVLKRLF